MKLFYKYMASVLFVNIFHKFEAGIANAISSFKYIKNDIIRKIDIDLPNWIIWLTKHLPQAK